MYGKRNGNAINTLNLFASLRCMANMQNGGSEKNMKIVKQNNKKCNYNGSQTSSKRWRKIKQRENI